MAKSSQLARKIVRLLNHCTMCVSLYTCVCERERERERNAKWKGRLHNYVEIMLKSNTVNKSSEYSNFIHLNHCKTDNTAPKYYANSKKLLISMVKQIQGNNCHTL